MVERILLERLRAALHQHLDSLESLPDAVWKRTGALNTWGTNALEGNTLTPADVERLLLDSQSIAGRPVSDVLETLQHEAAFRGLLARIPDPIDLVTVQEMHEQVFHGLPPYRPGQWRLSNPYIGGTRHRPPRRERVVARLEAWLRSYADRRAAGDDVFTLAAFFHHEFESIHPFEDGNGRAGRLLLNLHFLQHDWPPIHLAPGDREDYLGALEAGHRDDFASLTSLLESAMARSLLDLLDQVGEARDALKPLASFAKRRWNPYGPHYLSLRARQGALAAIHASNTSAPTAAKIRPGRPRWLTSERALRYYIATRSRSDAGTRSRSRDGAR